MMPSRWYEHPTENASMVAYQDVSLADIETHVDLLERPEPTPATPTLSTNHARGDAYAFGKDADDHEPWDATLADDGGSWIDEDDEDGDEDDDDLWGGDDADPWGGDDDSGDDVFDEDEDDEDDEDDDDLFVRASWMLGRFD